MCTICVLSTSTQVTVMYLGARVVHQHQRPSPSPYRSKNEAATHNLHLFKQYQNKNCCFNICILYAPTNFAYCSKRANIHSSPSRAESSTHIEITHTHTFTRADMKQKFLLLFSQLLRICTVFGHLSFPFAHSGSVRLFLSETRATWQAFYNFSTSAFAHARNGLRVSTFASSTHHTVHKRTRKATKKCISNIRRPYAARSPE